MTILVSKDKRNRSPGNEADTLTQSMSQAIKCGMNYICFVRVQVVASFGPKMVVEVILEHLILKYFGGKEHVALNLGFPFQILSQSSETKSRMESLGLKLEGMPPEPPSCCVVVVTCHSNLKCLPPLRGWLLSGCHSSVAEHWQHKPSVMGLIPGDCQPFHFLLL